MFYKLEVTMQAGEVGVRLLRDQGSLGAFPAV